MQPASPHILSLRRVSAVAAANALEFYGFLTFAFFAPQISLQLFGEQDDATALLASLATFGVAYLVRPLGAVVIGIMGDTEGRKPAMLLSCGLMGLSIVGLALTPPSASIGAAAAVLVILFRLVQGFALGGEVGPASAFLLEAAPLSQRGLYVSLQFSTQWAGGLAAGLVWLGLKQGLSPEAFEQWGWRIALLLGASVVPAGLLVRARMPETLGVRAEAGPVTPVPLRFGLFGLMMLAGGTIVTYMLGYLRPFAQDVLGLSPGVAFAAVVTSEFFGALVNPLGGILSDRMGRRKTVLAAMGALLLAAPLCFAAIASIRTPLALLAGTAVTASLLALATPSILALMAETLTQRYRSSGIGIVYALAISIFGSTTQIAAAWLTAATGSLLAPAGYLVVALLVGLAGAAALRETAPGREPAPAPDAQGQFT